MQSNAYIKEENTETIHLTIGITDLGIIVSNNMSWNRHIEETVMRANKTLGLLKRVCKEMRDPNIRKLLYCALVRPKVEYGSNLWSPYTSKHRALLENTQRRATKFMLNYPKNLTYKERLIELNLLRIIGNLIHLRGEVIKHNFYRYRISVNLHLYP